MSFQVKCGKCGIPYKKADAVLVMRPGDKTMTPLKDNESMWQEQCACLPIMPDVTESTDAR